MKRTSSTTRSGPTYRRTLLFGAAVTFIASFAIIAEGAANCTGSCATGLGKCMGWCKAHNKTDNSQQTCFTGCVNYWLSGKNPQSIGPADPRQSYVPGKEPPKSIGQ